MTEKSGGMPDSMGCPAAREAVSAAIDRELGANDQPALVAHRLRCEACERYARWVSWLNQSIRDELAEGTNTDLLWRRISTALDAKTLEADPHPKRVPGRAAGQLPRRVFVMSGAAVAAALAVAVAGVITRGSLRSDQLPVVAEAVNDFLTFRASGRSLDVANDAPHEIKAWLAARVAFDLPIGLLAPDGFRLSGARLCSFLHRRLALLHYERGAGAASLYVMDDDGLSLPSEWNRNLKGRAVAVSSHKGLSNVVWRNGGLVYVVVSDLAEAEVLGLVAAI